VLGSGSFGKVFKAPNRNDPSLTVAIKVLDKEKLGKCLGMVMDEIEVISMLNHPNIVTHFETYDDIRYVYIGKIFEH
jgi:serine/threonine protein kinase